MTPVSLHAANSPEKIAHVRQARFFRRHLIPALSFERRTPGVMLVFRGLGATHPPSRRTWCGVTALTATRDKVRALGERGAGSAFVRVRTTRDAIEPLGRTSHRSLLGSPRRRAFSMPRAMRTIPATRATNIFGTRHPNISTRIPAPPRKFHGLGAHHAIRFRDRLSQRNPVDQKFLVASLDA